MPSQGWTRPRSTCSQAGAGRCGVGPSATTTSAASASSAALVPQAILGEVVRRRARDRRRFDGDPTDVTALRTSRVLLDRATPYGLGVDRPAFEAADALHCRQTGLLVAGVRFHAVEDPALLENLRCSSGSGGCRVAGFLDRDVDRDPHPFAALRTADTPLVVLSALGLRIDRVAGPATDEPGGIAPIVHMEMMPHSASTCGAAHDAGGRLASLACSTSAAICRTSSSSLPNACSSRRRRQSSSTTRCP